MSKFYLAGPMSGYPEHNVPAFTEASARLRSEGIDIVNPAECEGVTDQASKTWLEWMRRDIGLLLDCEGVYCLPKWEASKGASLEVHIAKTLGLPIYCANTKEPIQPSEREGGR